MSGTRELADLELSQSVKRSMRGRPPTVSDMKVEARRVGPRPGVYIRATVFLADAGAVNVVEARGWGPSEGLLALCLLMRTAESSA